MSATFGNSVFRLPRFLEIVFVAATPIASGSASSTSTRATAGRPAISTTPGWKLRVATSLEVRKGQAERREL
jgi:hypothetical protein